MSRFTAPSVNSADTMKPAPRMFRGAGFLCLGLLRPAGRDTLGCLLLVDEECGACECCDEQNLLHGVTPLIFGMVHPVRPDRRRLVGSRSSVGTARGAMLHIIPCLTGLFLLRGWIWTSPGCGGFCASPSEGGYFRDSPRGLTASSALGRILGA